MCLPLSKCNNFPDLCRSSRQKFPAATLTNCDFCPRVQDQDKSRQPRYIFFRRVHPVTQLEMPQCCNHKSQTQFIKETNSIESGSCRVPTSIKSVDHDDPFPPASPIKKNTTLSDLCVEGNITSSRRRSLQPHPQSCPIPHTLSSPPFSYSTFPNTVPKSSKFSLSIMYRTICSMTITLSRALLAFVSSKRFRFLTPPLRQAQAKPRPGSRPCLLGVLALLAVSVAVGQAARNTSSAINVMDAQGDGCSTMQCGDERKCVLRGGEPRCVCSPKCYLKHRSPVCGNDGRTYRSECHLLKRACRKKRRLLVEHYGSCQTCSGVRCRAGKSCVLSEDLVPHCRRCPPLCRPRTTRRPLCAVDGHTYMSTCHLKEAACAAGRVVKRAYRGACQANATCASVRCWRGERCLTERGTDRPVCFPCDARRDCGPAQRPVCSVDGRTYSSICSLAHESCRTGTALVAAPRRFCNKAAVSRARKSCSEWQRRAALRRRAKLAMHALRLRTAHPLQHTAMSRYGLRYAQISAESADTTEPSEGDETTLTIGEDEEGSLDGVPVGEVDPAQTTSLAPNKGQGLVTVTENELLATIEENSLIQEKRMRSERNRNMRKNCRRKRQRRKNIKKAKENGGQGPLRHGHRRGRMDSDPLSPGDVWNPSPLPSTLGDGQ